VTRFLIYFILTPFFLANNISAVTSDARGHKDSVNTVVLDRAKPVYQTIRLSSPAPKIDGQLNDNCWLKDGNWSGNYTQYMPEEGLAPSQETELKILFDDANIYVAIRAYDNEPEKIDFRPAERDEFNGDVVGLAFDSYNDQRTAFEFNLTSSGGKIDLLLMNDHWDVNWNAVWDGKTALEDSAWTAEFKIPLSQLRYANGHEQEWGLHAWRWLSRNAEESQWALIPRDSPAKLSEIGKLSGLETRKKSRRLEIQPYGLAMAESSEKQADNPFANGYDHRISGGLDAKIGLTTDFTMDVTINPDFGQVEADPSVLNLSAFEVFYEERRPFFLEGNNILSYDYGHSNQLFYTRRIGRTPRHHPSLLEDEYAKVPGNTSIISAVKVTGKNRKGTSIGVMQSVTARETAEIRSAEGPSRYETIEPLTSYSVIRLQRDINEANTIIGGMLTATNRDLNNQPQLNHIPRSAYTGGIDFRHQWKNKTYFVDFKGIFSHVSGDTSAITTLQYASARYMQRPDFPHLGIDSNLTSLVGSGGELSIGKAGNGRWRYELSVSTGSPKLELNDIGFLRYTDMISQRTSLSYVVNDPFSIFRSLSSTLSLSNYWNMGGYYTSSRLRGSIMSQFTNKWRTMYSMTRRFEGLQTRELRGGPALLTPGKWENTVSLSSDHSKKVYFRFFFDSEVSDDRISSTFLYSPAISFRIGNSIQFSSSISYSLEKENLQYVSQEDMDSDPRYIMGYLNRKTMSFTLRADYGITPELTIQYYGSPYLSTGLYNDFKRITDSRAELYGDRFHTFAGQEISFDPEDNVYHVDETGNGNIDYGFSNPDFNFKQFRSNLVARWEYRPGSILYLVWQHSRTGYDAVTDPSIANNMGELWDIYPTDILMLKLNYWFSL